ncbi:MAG TPA: DUF6797 domain-containing protein [Chthoniobacteraceae bacterium]
MHKQSRTILSTVILGLTSISAFAGRWDDMDYGRFLSATYLNPEGKSTLDGKGCATNKGIAIKLDKEGTATMLFDTDLLRMSGGWTGGFVKLKGVVFDGAHGPNPGPAEKARMIFQTNPGPGWSKGDDLADPRKLPVGTGAAKVPFGPLPSDWAKYKGLFLSGDNVVLTYTVGSAGVLEMPSSTKAGEESLLTRTFNITSKGSGPAHLVVADNIDAPNSDSIDSGTPLGVKDDPANAESRLMIAVVGAPKGSAWTVRDGRVLLKLPAFAGGEAFKIIYSKGAAADGAKFQAAVQGAGEIPKLTELTKGGTPHWPQVVTTKGELNKGGGKGQYVVDHIEPPFENPYKSWIRFAGHDFFKDGSAALCTWSGDVWIASGLDDKLAEVKWRRYATGLHQSLGLKVVDDKVYVLGRDQITRLHDLNKDGEADLYENFNNDVQVTPGFHEFALDLHTDPQGNFYFAKGGPVNPGGSGWGPLGEHNGTILKVSKDGQKLEVFATGVRAPNGMGVGPNGEVTCGDNQGTWVPACYVHLVKSQGEFVGVTDLAHRAEKPTDYTRHVAFLPMDVDNSGGAQFWVTSEKWGPFKGKLFHLSYGQTTMHQMLTESVNGQIQGGAVQFPVKFETGAMRARFSNHDGQLYVSGLRGWQTKGSKDAGFYRVRYTGGPVTMQTSMKVTDKGIHIGFTNPVEEESAKDAENYSIEQWNYRWTSAYGSPEFKVSNPEEKGHDAVEIKSVKLAMDKKSVFLEVPGLQPVMQMKIKMNINAADGTELPNQIVNTINAVGKE